MAYKRICVKPGCSNIAGVAFTYVYDDKTIVIGPLSPLAEPGVYDLCEKHSKTFIAPKGWQIIRLQTQIDNHVPSSEELDYLAEAIIVASKKKIVLPVFEPPNINNVTSFKAPF